MNWILRVAEDDPGGTMSIRDREEAGRVGVDGDLYAVAREAALLAERHGLLVLVYRERVEGEWLFACESRGGGRFWWTGPPDVVAACEGRHRGWREELLGG